jgi:LmbE family N-acetylglucosaminyl deacetylase
MSRRLAVVVAHPDDDTFGVTGTAALHADDRSFELTAVLVTSGDAGEIADPRLATPETLGDVREGEDRASWAALGVVPARHEFLRYPDGLVAEVPREELVARIADILRAQRPDVVVTFGPDGITAHVDHVRTGDVTTEAFHRVRAEGGEGLRRLLYTALPTSRLRWFSDRLVERGLDPIDPTQPYQPRGVPDEAIAVEVDCSNVWRRRLLALREHRTQGGADVVPADLAEPMLSFEWYTQAWPARPQNARRLGSVFEGLDDS